MNTKTILNSAHRAVQVYLLAAPEDEAVCEEIHKHLSPLIRSSRIPIAVSGDFLIPSGEDREKYKQRLFEADVVLALISADFIDNDDIYSRNQKVIERYNNHETVMIPILVRNFLWKSTPFVSLPVLPKNLQPLNNKQFWNSPDDAVTAVVSDIYESINELTQSEAVQPWSAAEAGSTPDLKATSERSISQTELQDSINELTQRETLEPAPAAEVERAPDLNGTSGTKKRRITSGLMAASPVEVDWRKRYYRRVVLKRAGAIFLDQFFLFFLPLVFFYSVNPQVAASEEFSNSELIIIFSMYFIVAPIMESSKWRGTIGKRILKLQITNRDGERISFLRALWRNIMRTIVLYSYLFVVPLLIQYFRFNKTKKLFHDELSGTVIGERLATSAGAVSVAEGVA
jgi:uncharacterized RDD family membrane protein YckC